MFEGPDDLHIFTFLTSVLSQSMKIALIRYCRYRSVRAKSHNIRNGSRLTAIFANCHMFCLGLAQVNEKYRLSISLARSCQC